MIPQWAPNIHPLLVHFPIAILVVAFLFDIASFFIPANDRSQKETQLSRLGMRLNPTIITLLYLAGTVFTLITYYSGQAAAEGIKLPAGAKEVLHQHSELALYTLLFFGFYVTIRLALTWDRDTIKRGLHAGLIIGAFIGLGILYTTAEHGGELVYGYGVGTGQLLHRPNKTETIPPDSSGASARKNTK